jgi:stage II sporulation protein AA (anti-sigma F factor antagonist)
VALKIERTVQENVLILRLRGEIDLKTAPDLRRALEQGLLGAQVQNVVLNLSDVTFIDSSGIGVLLGRYKELKQSEGQLIIVAPRPHVDTVLQLSGLGRVIPFADSEEEALELVREKRGQDK